MLRCINLSYIVSASLQKMLFLSIKKRQYFSAKNHTLVQNQYLPIFTSSIPSSGFNNEITLPYLCLQRGKTDFAIFDSESLFIVKSEK